MSLLNPIFSNVQIGFSDSFFPDTVTKKYNDFLFHKNDPFRTVRAHIIESMQSISVPGISLQTLVIAGLSNTGRDLHSPDFPNTTITRTYPGTESLNSVIDSTVATLTFRNTLLNWMYFMEFCRKYYKRTREVDLFDFNLTMMDSGEIPMVRFNFSDCFLSVVPGLDFNMGAGFLDSKIIDIGITFNEMSLDFLIPGFNIERIILK